jgi:hypothetical protein
MDENWHFTLRGTDDPTSWPSIKGVVSYNQIVGILINAFVSYAPSRKVDTNV